MTPFNPAGFCARAYLTHIHPLRDVAVAAGFSDMG
jgi:hypothetical protein